MPHRLRRKHRRNVEMIWLTDRLTPSFKTIADFRWDRGVGIRNVGRRFAAPCYDLRLFSQALVANRWESMRVASFWTLRVSAMVSHEIWLGSLQIIISRITLHESTLTCEKWD
ncbi:protein of unknown function (plasmid) [Caballeronia sp. S22]